MSARLELSIPDQPDADTLRLGEILIPGEPGQIGQGEAVRVQGQNTGDTVLRDVVVRVEGAGAENVQLAVDSLGEPGVWAAPGEPVIVHSGSLFRGEGFAMWAKGLYAYEDDEERRPFRLIASATSIGG